MAFQLLVILDSDLRKPKAICEDGARARTNFEGNNDAEWAVVPAGRDYTATAVTVVPPLRRPSPVAMRAADLWSHVLFSSGQS